MRNVSSTDENSIHHTSGSNVSVLRVIDMKIKLLVIVIFLSLSNIKTSVTHSENLDGIVLYCECFDTGRNCIDDINAQGNENKVEFRNIEEFRDHIIQFFGENVRDFILN
jgi:hypothetical protein